MKILIIGGTGAMGVHLVEILSQDDNNILFVTSRKNRVSNKRNVLFVCGDGMDSSFIIQLMTFTVFDVVVDFMVYTTNQFGSRINDYLRFTKQYIFLSSARVFADELIITEQSRQLLDSCSDEDYIQTDEYALAKARQEKILKKSEFSNWTIVRPYISYSEQRLQFCEMEKEEWLYRVLRGRTLVFSEDIASKYTTLTYARDVANSICKLVGNNQALRNEYNITSHESCKWIDVLGIYEKILEQYRGGEITKKRIPNSLNLRDSRRKWQVLYDRELNRCFDNGKISSLCHDSFVELKNGLEISLNSFLQQPLFGPINWKKEAEKDRICHERAKRNEFDGWRIYFHYLIWRYL